MREKIIICLLCFLSVISLYSQNERSFVRKGNRNIEKSKYHEAEIDYLKALEVNPLLEEGGYNLGNALYKQEKFDEAAFQYNSVGERTDDNDMKESSYFNLGNSMYKAQKYDVAVAAYKNALKINPNNEDARYNLAMAQHKLNKQGGGQSQQNQQGDDQQNQDQQSQDQQNQDQQNQAQQDGQSQQSQQDQQNQDQQNQQQGQQNEDSQGEEQQAQQMQISKEDAERMLEALKNSEQKTLIKVQDSKSQGQKVKIDKDW